MFVRKEVYKAADLHVHGGRKELGFDDGEMSPEDIAKKAAETGLSVVAYTSHGTVAYGKEAQAFAKRRFGHVKVVTGMEVSCGTTEDERFHILGLFLTDDIPSKLPMGETVDLIRKQGGLAVIAHPTQRHGKFRDPQILLDLMKRQGVRFDGIEVLNGAINSCRNLEAQILRDAYPDLFGAQIGGSDAHQTFLAKAITLFPGVAGGRSDDELKGAIVTKQTLVLSGDFAFQSGIIQSAQALMPNRVLVDEQLLQRLQKPMQV